MTRHIRPPALKAPGETAARNWIGLAQGLRGIGRQIRAPTEGDAPIQPRRVTTTELRLSEPVDDQLYDLLLALVSKCEAIEAYPK